MKRDATQLIQNYCANGDQEAFRRFYRQEASSLWRFLVARGSRQEDAYDLVAESFLRFVSTVCRDPAFPRALLYRIAINAHIDHYRHEQILGEPIELESLEERAAEGADFGDYLAVRQAVDRLHARERDLILMRYWIGMTHAEIAQALEMPEGTVRRQAATALHRLRGLLELEDGA